VFVIQAGLPGQADTAQRVFTLEPVYVVIAPNDDFRDALYIPRYITPPNDGTSSFAVPRRPQPRYDLLIAHVGIDLGGKLRALTSRPVREEVF
jgi:hypothetical protein